MAVRVPGLGDLYQPEEKYTLETIAKAVAANDWEAVTEASIGRILQHHQNSGKKSYAVVSGWRSDAPDRATNIDNTNKLQRHLSDKGYGYNKLTGMGQEEGGKVSANEPSYFVHGMTREHAIEAGSKFGQHSVLYAGPETSGHVHLIRTTIFPGETAKVGDHEDLGTFHSGAVGQYFSRLRGKSHKAGVDDLKTHSAPKQGKMSKSSTKDFTFKEDFVPVLYKGDTTNEMRWFDTRVTQLTEDRRK